MFFVEINDDRCYRIQEAKKITKRYSKDIMLLVERLDSHGDGFRTASMEPEIKPEVGSKPSRATPKAQTSKQSEKLNATGGKKTGPKRKSKADKVSF